MSRKHVFTLRLSERERNKLEVLATSLQRSRGDALRQLLNGAHRAVIAADRRAVDAAYDVVDSSGAAK